MTFSRTIECRVTAAVAMYGMGDLPNDVGAV